MAAQRRPVRFIFRKKEKREDDKNKRGGDKNEKEKKRASYFSGWRIEFKSIEADSKIE